MSVHHQRRACRFERPENPIPELTRQDLIDRR